MHNFLKRPLFININLIPFLQNHKKINNLYTEAILKEKQLLRNLNFILTHPQKQ